MWIANNWNDYKVIDCSQGEKLESWGGYLLVRPDPQVIWNTPKTHKGWKRPNAHYHRSERGGGEWEFLKKLPERWTVSHEDLKFWVRPTGFKHTGLFPEQAANWIWMSDLIRKSRRKDLKILNLFGYTGGATLACVEAGAHVTHVDASKGMVAWGKENAVSSGLADRPMRWLVDDCGKFVQRELRRGNTYDGILMDPPSYGRGPGGEVWKLEEQIYPLVQECVKLLSDKPLFFLINSYTTGLSPSVMQYVLGSLLPKNIGGKLSADEIGLPVTASGMVLPCGATAMWSAAMKSGD